MRLSGRKASPHLPRWAPPQRLALLSLIGCNLAFFCAQQVLQLYRPEIIPEYLGLSDRGIDQAYAWKFISALFLHAGLFHLVSNMLLLYVAGRDLESILGPKQFVYIYLCGAVGGELGHLFVFPSATVLLGASGGVAAAIVALATILPDLELTSASLFSVPLRLKAKHLGYGLFVFGLIMSGVIRTGMVAHTAIIGGCAAGWLYAHLLGFGRPSMIQRILRRRHAREERRRRMTTAEFVAEEIDPLLEKIARSGWRSLSRSERRILAQASTRMTQSTPAN